MLWRHQHARLSLLAAGSPRQGPRADSQSLGRSWFGQRGAKSLLFLSIPCLVLRSGPSSCPRAVLWRRFYGDFERDKRIAVTRPASSEAVGALLGPKGGWPRVV